MLDVKNERLPDGSVSSVHYWWDFIPAKYEVNNPPVDRDPADEYVFVFDCDWVPVYIVNAVSVHLEDLSSCDLYVTPASLGPWMYVLTHEDQFGPYFIDELQSTIETQ